MAALSPSPFPSVQRTVVEVASGALSNCRLFKAHATAEKWAPWAIEYEVESIKEDFGWWRLEQRNEPRELRLQRLAELKKWLYLNLAWLFENQTSLDDALGAIEVIYSDFDYPEELAPFVRYMPVMDNYDPGAHTTGENQARLVEKWRNYLTKKAQIFAPPTAPNERRSLGKLIRSGVKSPETGSIFSFLIGDLHLE